MTSRPVFRTDWIVHIQRHQRARIDHPTEIPSAASVWPRQSPCNCGQRDHGHIAALSLHIGNAERDCVVLSGTCPARHQPA
jgi:hypothetical protein